MRSFFKLIFTSCLGTILALILLSVVLMIVAGLSNRGKNNIPDKSVLLLDFQGLLPEKTDNVSSSGSNFQFDQTSALGTFDMVELIKHAATDDRIEEIVIRSENTMMSAAKMIQLADALAYLRENSEKPIRAYGSFFTQSGYLLASEADSIYLNPQGGIDVRGYGVVLSFMKDMLDKLGVNMRVFYAGEFKSAAEVFYRNEMSENNKLQTREFLQVIHDNYVDRISQNRNLEPSTISHVINNYTFSNADSTLIMGGVDALMQWHEFEARLRDRLDIKKGKPINYVNLKEYDKKTTISKKNTAKDRIAVVFAEGEIRYGQEGYGVINEVSYHEVFDKIRKDDKIKAVVLRVNSPGGSSYTSEVILEEVKSLQNDGIPVVASFGSYAASGGYYISCSADTIVCEENTLTGSIGVFSVFTDASKLLEDKIGVHFDTVKTGPFATSFFPYMSMTEKEMAFVEKNTDKIYDTFLSRVSEGRGLPIEQVKSAAEGRVWTGLKAKELGLVDEIGNLDKALEIAAEMADLESYKLREFPFIEKPPWMQIVESFNESSVFADLIGNSKIHTEIKKLHDDVMYFTEHKAPQMLMPVQMEY